LDKNLSIVLTENEKSILKDLLATQKYSALDAFFEQVWARVPREDKEIIRVNQAYSLEKANKTKEAMKIWQSLYQSDSKYAQVYWALGRYYHDQEGRINDFYENTRELQINALTQRWLAAQLPNVNTKLTAPKFTNISAKVDAPQNGVLVQANIFDPDGDVDKVLVRYHWDNQPVIEKEINIKPFQYETSINQVFPAPGTSFPDTLQ